MPVQEGQCGKACMSDADCAGGFNPCGKCDTTPGTRFTCVKP